MSVIKRWFGRLLRNSRFVVLDAVLSSIVAGCALFYLATADAGESHAPHAEGK
jgi:hypothetical protein